MIEQLDKDELLALLHKRCSKCGVVKYFGEFSKQARCAGGVTSFCRACDRERGKSYREKNIEKERSRCLKYRLKHREERAEYWHRWCEENRERRSDAGRKYREKNKEKRVEYERKHYRENRETYAERRREHYENNREAYADNARRRRARRASAAGTHTPEQAKARFDYYGNKCVYCGSGENLQIEHRIPLARGGSDWPANLAPACKSCNCSKHTKTETEFKKLLEKRNE